MDGGLVWPPVGSEHFPNGHVVWGGVVALHGLINGSFRGEAPVVAVHQAVKGQDDLSLKEKEAWE